MIEDTELKVLVPTIDIQTYSVDERVLPLVPEAMARRLKILPLFKVEHTLVVGMSDPNDFIALNELKRTSGLDIFPVLSEESKIATGITYYYQSVDSLQEELAPIIQEIRNSTVLQESLTPTPDRKVYEEETPVIRLVLSMIRQSVKLRASDIHIEPDELKFRMRYRIDGVLQELATFPISLLSPIISRIKIIAGMDITESRQPQDGGARLDLDSREIDLRVSTFPTVHGENMVVRVLDRAVLNLDLERLGISKAILPSFESSIQSSYGIVLVAGPTGSGKTTTLYAVLNKINSIHKNIVTVEDPVEYSLDLIRQSQINPKVGLTFATGLRSILRQDPDIILVGEMRDLETTEISIQAALTGHLVFSTVHTNDAPSTIARLIEMGAEPFLVASSVNSIIAQRLVRRICPHCQESYEPDPEVLASIKWKADNKASAFFRGKGCIHCRYSGYSGRIGIYELLSITDEIRDLIVRKASSSQIRRAAIDAGMIGIFDDGCQKVIDGLTTIDEVIRVTRMGVEQL